MGCGTSRSETEVVSATDTGSKNRKKELNGNGIHAVSKKSKNSTPKKPAVGGTDSALLPGSVPDSDEQSESMPPPVSFDIPADTGSSIIKKHPPKRLHKLEEQQISVSHHDLQAKQMSAEERRQKMLLERIQSSRRSANPANRRIPLRDQMAVHDQVSKKFLKVPKAY